MSAIGLEIVVIVVCERELRKKYSFVNRGGDEYLVSSQVDMPGLTFCKYFSCCEVPLDNCSRSR